MFNKTPKINQKRLKDLAKVDYFDLFALSKQLPLDKKTLEAKYAELMRENHPDNFLNSEEELATKNSEIINEAFKILCNHEEAIKYLVRDEKSDELLTQDLMEVFQLKENIVQGDQEAKAILQIKLEKSYSRLNFLINNGHYHEAKQLLNHYLLMKKI